MYVSSRQGYKPPVKSTGRGKKYSHFASLKYCNGAETFYTVSYHAYIPLLKFNNIVMNKIIKQVSYYLKNEIGSQCKKCGRKRFCQDSPLKY